MNEKSLPEKFRNLKGKLWPFPGNSPTCSSKMHSTSPQGQFEGSVCILKFGCLYFSRILNNENLAFSQKVSAGAWKLHFTCSEKQFEELCYFWRWKCASKILNLELKNWDLLLNTLQQRCLNYTLLVQKNEPNKVSGVN